MTLAEVHVKWSVILIDRLGPDILLALWKDLHEYEPESLAVMQCSLDRHSKNCGRNYSILQDHEVKARELWAQGYGKW